MIKTACLSLNLHEIHLYPQTSPPQVAFRMRNGDKWRTSHLYTVKRVCDFGGIFHSEEGAQVSSSVEKLNLKSFVSKGNLTADK